jgi:hypothetical protein
MLVGHLSILTLDNHQRTYAILVAIDDVESLPAERE